MRRIYRPSLSRMPLSAIFYALSDPVRLGIVRCLLKDRELACGEFSTRLSKSTMSHHFKVLREAGLIQSRQEGTSLIISLRLRELKSRCPKLVELLAKAARPL